MSGPENGILESRLGSSAEWWESAVSFFDSAKRAVVWVLLFGVGYGLTARMSRGVLFQNSHIGIVWVPNALLVSALILTPRKSWWLVVAVSALAHFTAMRDSTPMWLMAWQIPANTLFAIISTELLRRAIGFPLRFERSREVLVYAGLALALPMLLALIAPAFVLSLSGADVQFTPAIAFVRIALANVSPLLIVTPAVLLCAELIRRRPNVFSRRTIDALIVIGSVLVVGVVALNANAELVRSPWLLILTFPPLIWAAVQLGPTGAAISLLCVAALSIWGASRELGQFVAAAHTDVVLSLQIYWIVICPPVMLLAATIREREAAEASLQDQRHQLAHVMRTATAGELSGELAHELRQPMQCILASAQAGLRILARDPADVAQIREILNEIVQQDRQASNVVARWRTLITGGTASLEPVALASVVNDTIALTRHAAMRANVHVQSRIPPDLPRVRGDHVQLLQVLVNLVVNGCESMTDLPAADRTLTLRVERAGSDRIDVAVADSGVGLPVQAADLMFQPFFTTKQTGLGLGLSISRSIAVAHGGRLWAENNDDRGATFHLELPTDLARGERHVGHGEGYATSRAD
jgi:signal transduction histidine kinase